MTRQMSAPALRHRRHKRAPSSAAVYEAVETFRLWANRVGIPGRRADVSRLASSQPGEVQASPPMVGVASTDQRHDTTRECGGGPSDSFDLCVVLALLRSSAFVSRPGGATTLCEWQATPRFRATFCTSMSSKMNVCDVGLRSDSLKNEFFQPVLRKSRGQVQVLSESGNKKPDPQSRSGNGKEAV